MVLARSRMLAPALAALLALTAILTGANGVDLAAATYRVELFARSGLTLWDSQWYGGHWTLNYSVLFAPIGWLTGIPLLAIACATLASWAFDRLAVARFGRAGRIASLTFAVGIVVQVAIGQEPYLLGEALALMALVFARGSRWPLGVLLGLAAALASPLAGGFLGLAALAWLIGSWPARRVPIASLGAAALVPVATLQLLFPGQGTMPFAPLNMIGMVTALVPLGIVAWRRDRSIAAGLALYGAAVLLAFVVPSAIGLNVTRLATSVGVPLLVALALERRSGRALLAAAAVPLSLLQWAPAAQSLLGGANPSTNAAYFSPLLRFLQHADTPLGRVEVVPTALHWEAAYVAPSFPLARGWERQLDTANNPIFYLPNRLSAASYRRWLFANGVRFVALPDVALDYAATAEGVLVAHHRVRGLRMVWHDAHWRVFGVSGAPGLVSGPARLLRSRGAVVRLQVSRPGVIVVRERYVDAWQVTAGKATVGPAPGGWLQVHATRPGRVEVRIKL